MPTDQLSDRWSHDHGPFRKTMISDKPCAFFRKLWPWPAKPSTFPDCGSPNASQISDDVRFPYGSHQSRSCYIYRISPDYYNNRMYIIFQCIDETDTFYCGDSGKNYDGCRLHSRLPSPSAVT